MDEKNITLERILDKVAQYFDVKPEDILSRNRKPIYQEDRAYIRSLFVYLCRQLTYASYDEIGKFMSNRDHTTIVMFIHRYCEFSITIPNKLQYDTNEIRKIIVSNDENNREQN